MYRTNRISTIVRTMSSFTKQQLEANYTKVVGDIEACAREIDVATSPRLVAVSKYKPKEDIQALYDLGQRHFGENYVQELTEKAEALPKDIKWHFIGSLQSNKCKVLAPIENLYAVETLDSEGKAQKLNNARKGHPLNVFIQVNTSGEEQKSGLNHVDDVIKVGKFIVDSCPNLVLKGLMTIGSLSSSIGQGENEDFKKLVSISQQVGSALGVSLELSMGMSNDFIEAIRQGSTNVRVGSSIFGGRPPKEEAKK